MTASSRFIEAMSRETRFRSAKVEALYWLASLGLAAAVLLFWRERGYWIWKQHPDFVFFAGMVSLFTCPVPCLLILLPFAIAKKKRAADLARTVQIILPLSAFSYALLGFENKESRMEDFSLYRSERERVVRDLKPGSFQPYEQIPVEVPNLATNDKVYVHRKDGEYMVWFPTRKWAIDNHAGFVYSETGKEPPRHSFYEVTRVERLDDHWFWIGTT